MPPHALPGSVPPDRPVPDGAGFDDRVLTLLGGGSTLSDVAGVLASSTRAAILAALIRSEAPLHIQELGRRVGVDASPARTHLEVLCRAGLAREVGSPSGRERRFTTDVTDARIVLVDANRVRVPAPAESPKEARRVERKLAGLAEKRSKLDREAAKLRGELKRVLSKA